MSKVTERFEGMVEELRGYPYLEVVKFILNPPIEKDALAAVEACIGAPLAAPIRDFYRAANGLELHWRFKPEIENDDDEYERLEKLSSDYEFDIPEDPDIPFAHINMIPLEDAAIQRKWDKVIIISDKDAEMEFANQKLTSDEFGKRLRPFDLFSTYQAMAFVLEPGVGDPKVMLISDYYIEWDGSRLTDFETYIEMLLATRGIVDARKSVFGEYGGDKKKPLLLGKDHWTEKRIPKLFQKEK